MTTGKETAIKEQLTAFAAGVLAAVLLCACTIHALMAFQSATKTQLPSVSNSKQVILCVGDQHSTQKKDASDWPSLLQTLLMFKHGQQAPELINLSRPGINTHQILRKLKTLLNTDSSNITVFLMCGTNNYWNSKNSIQKNSVAQILKSLFRLLMYSKYKNIPGPELTVLEKTSQASAGAGAEFYLQQALRNENLKNWKQVLFYRYKLREIKHYSPENLYALGQAHLKLGQNKQAQKLFKNGRSKYPEKAVFAFGLGRAAFNEFKYKQAEEYFKLAKNLTPPLPPELSVFLARTLRAQEKPEQAIDELKKQLKTGTSSKNIRNELGLCLADSKRHKEALRIFADCARDFPADIIFYERCAWLCILDSRYTQARAWIKKGLRISPQNTALLKSEKTLNRLENKNLPEQEKEISFSAQKSNRAKSQAKPTQKQKTYRRTNKIRISDKKTIKELSQIISLCQERRAKIYLVRYPFEARENALMKDAAAASGAEFIEAQINRTNSRAQRAATLAAAVFRHSQNDIQQ